MSASLDPDLVPPALLDELADALRAAPSTRARVVGTRAASPPEHEPENEHLALDRARSVAAALAARGVDPEILDPEAGPERGFFSHKRAVKERPPPCPPPGEDRGHRSRRVEIVVLRCEPEE
ncbi:MAG: OmpA family protein [Sandaracinaceae bacterium]|nr:OmpA family protein [Sandaracinaceae bacterium]